ncbi:hypothetical protein [Rubritalea sp.]|uniref:hypothetical protein n=1 Tax=Rubritalea sp. TaxID=2109375 RepID=UPI003EF637C4
MENPYQSPQTQASTHDNKSDGFVSAYKYLKGSIWGGMFFIVISIPISLLTQNKFTSPILSHIGLCIAAIGLGVIALALLLIIPFTLWGFRTGLKAAQRNNLKPKTERHTRYTL